MKFLTVAAVLAATLALPAAAVPASATNAPAAKAAQPVSPRQAPEPAGWALLAIGGLLTALRMSRRPRRAEAFSQPA
ncbi:hypothetical protein [Pseudoduganella chitinolytica]|uniref:PEP-CTERM sorting domain-containing protein n=1 Tax=Pseudoduganella chitinolytica TaxID=34070 RepID=A0ABY8B941_9BURK|nr:hypothetical protein [Pseudoduganella chitinolytica]WEF32445.1 hypothetical protein PX653_24025 [Pseudoduganella chitinolytica]